MRMCVHEQPTSVCTPIRIYMYIIKYKSNETHNLFLCTRTHTHTHTFVCACLCTHHTHPMNIRMYMSKRVCTHVLIFNKKKKRRGGQTACLLFLGVHIGKGSFFFPYFIGSRSGPTHDYILHEVNMLTSCLLKREIKLLASCKFFLKETGNWVSKFQQPWLLCTRLSCGVSWIYTYMYIYIYIYIYVCV
jgi:hypothetical protein